MPTSWSPTELQQFGTAPELQITTFRDDGTRRRPVPIWVVTAAGEVYVRTWHRRENGWYGRAVASGRAHVSVPGVDADVDVQDVGADDAPLRESVDDAYRAKYGHGDDGSVSGMVGDEPAATTLRLTRKS